MSTHKGYNSILMFGPPGVGKGTQGKILGNVPGFFHLSVGDVFRSIDIGSPYGKEVYKYTSEGNLVPDELTVQIWKKALDAYVALSTYKPREDLLVLDGIPRNIAQTKLIDEHIQISQVINFSCDDEEEMMKRMRRRRGNGGPSNSIANRNFSFYAVDAFVRPGTVVVLEFD